jgi:spermidine synthase
MRPFPAAVILFFLSGALGLGYELVWIRKAALVVGASQIALSTVLTAFFLGLGLGSYAVGRWLRSRRWSPLFVYGLFEAAIGLFALAFPLLFRGLEGLYGAAYPLFAESAAGLFALRFTLLFLLFLPPTFLMGGTLPLLLDGLVAEDRSIGSRTSFLYGVNILGAVAGVLATGYFAIPILGMNGTSLAGGAGNLAIGAVALAAFRRLRPLHAEAEEAPLERFFPLAAFVSGLLAIAYQVMWARYFTLFHTTTVYLTALLLAVYLLALSAGSFLLAPLLAARWNPLRILAAVQALVPLAALYTLGWWRAAEHRVSLAGELTSAGAVVPKETLEIDRAYPLHWELFSEPLTATFLAPLFQTALVIFLPVLLIGAGLPSLIAAATRRSAGLRSTAGRVVFWNTLGSSAGGFIAGYVLLPFLGLHSSLIALGIGSLLLSFAAGQKAGALDAPAAASRRQRRHEHEAQPSRPAGAFRRFLLPTAGLAGVILFAATREDVTRSTIREHGYGWNPAAKGMALIEVLEGPLTSSFVFEDARSLQVGSGNVSLAAVYKQSYSTQAIQGHVPCLFYPGSGLPENCLGICLGSGQSFGALLLYPIRRLDVVDISSEIVELSLRYFEPYNRGLGRDPRVRFHLDDGRHFIERAPSDFYDVISMEPPPPTADGVYSLYSLEFYSEAARILRQGGVFMQWLPLYRITPLDTRGIIKTQAAVFPETFVVKVGRDDFMVVSYKSRPRFETAAIRERAKVFARERMVEGSRWAAGCRHDMASFEGVLSLLLMGPEDVGRLEAPLIYRDDRQLLSYSSGDRGLLRLYEGPALSPLSFAALELSPFARLNAYFDPPLPPELLGELEAERAASLAFFKVPDPHLLRAEVVGFQAALEPGERAGRALAIAKLLDGALRKKEAFTFVAQALAAQPEGRDPRHLEIARGIARNRVAVYHPLVEEQVRALLQRHPGAPLVAAMAEELEAYRQRAGRKRGR